MARSRDRWLRVACRVAAAVVWTPLSAWAWVGIVDRPSPELEVGRSRVAYAPHGDVVVVGRTDISGDQGLLTVVKFSRSGRLRWQTTPTDVLTTDPRSLAIDRAGHVYVAGPIGGDDEDTFGPGTLIKFDGADGHETWRWRPSDHEGLLAQVATDEWGHAFVVGDYVRPSDDPDGVLVGIVAKLDGALGQPRWLVETPEFSRAVVTLTGGDVVTVEGAHVRRRSGITGNVIWQANGLVSGYGVESVAVDPRGDVIGVGTTGHLLKLSGDDGDVQWQTTLAGFGLPVGLLTDVAVDRYGDVIVSGALATEDLGDFAVIKVAGSDGTELWRYVAEREGMGKAVAVAVDGRGNVVATGQHAGRTYEPRFTVVQLDGSSGDVNWLRMRPEDGGGSDIAVDRVGRAIVSGVLVQRDPPLGIDINLVVARLSASGRGLTDPLHARERPRPSPRDPSDLSEM